MLIRFGKSIQVKGVDDWKGDAILHKEADLPFFPPRGLILNWSPQEEDHTDWDVAGGIILGSYCVKTGNAGCTLEPLAVENREERDQAVANHQSRGWTLRFIDGKVVDEPK